MGRLDDVRVVAAAMVAIVPLVAATWVMPTLPYLTRQLLLCVWGVGTILIAECLLFRKSFGQGLLAVGFSLPRAPVLVVALLASVPMWAFLPLLARSQGLSISLRADWLQVLSGVLLVNGITEEVIHRGFVFGHFRGARRFTAAAMLSAIVFAAQHLYLIATIGWTVGLASVLLAALLAFPLAFAFERGGNSLAAPALLHTSSNAPVMVFALPDTFIATALVPHMGVVLVSLYLVFVFHRFATRRPVARAI